MESPWMRQVHLYCYQLNFALLISFFNIGNVYIADMDSHRIRKVTISTGIISTIAGTGTASYSGDGGAATSAEIRYPYGVAVDTSGIPSIKSL